jgi:predicted nucleotidyltransferase
VEDQLERVVVLLRAVWKDDLAGAYLFGSATSGGGLRPTSDVDVLGVLERRATRAERRRLLDGLLELSKRPRLLEVTVVALPEVRPWRFPPRLELQYGDWWRAELERGEEPWPDRDPDLAVLLTMVLQSGRTLAGPPAAELLESVPHEDVLRAADTAVDAVLRDLDGDTRNVLLTLARVWLTTETGEIRSKDAAAAWALERLDAPALARARDLYLEGGYGPWDGLDPRGDAERLAAAIRAGGTAR